LRTIPRSFIVQYKYNNPFYNRFCFVFSHPVSNSLLSFDCQQVTSNVFLVFCNGLKNIAEGLRGMSLYVSSKTLVFTLWDRGRWNEGRWNRERGKANEKRQEGNRSKGGQQVSDRGTEKRQKNQNRRYKMPTPPLKKKWVSFVGCADVGWGEPKQYIHLKKNLLSL